MALRRSSENFRKSLCAALLIASAFLITPAAAAAPAGDPNPTHPGKPRKGEVHAQGGKAHA